MTSHSWVQNFESELMFYYYNSMSESAPHVCKWSKKNVQKVNVLNFYRLQKFLFEQKNYLVTLVHIKLFFDIVTIPLNASGEPGY